MASVDEVDDAIHLVIDEVQRYARFRLGQAEDAEDAAMETWHALRQSPVPFLSADEPRRYAIGVCRRKVADVLRRRRWRFWAGPNLGSDFDREMMVGRTLQALSDDQREVLALKYFHQFSTEEIAEMMRRSPASVNSLLQRARKSFADAAEPWFQDERK